MILTKIIDFKNYCVCNSVLVDIDWNYDLSLQDKKLNSSGKHLIQKKQLW